MPRARYRRRRRYDDSYDSYRPRRRGCLSALRRLFLRAVTVLLVLLGTILVLVLAALIALHLPLFLLVVHYALYVALGLGILGLLYLVIRISTAISHRLSAASVARSKARQERVQVRMQQVKLAREAALVEDEHRYPRVPRPRVVQEQHGSLSRHEHPQRQWSPSHTVHLAQDSQILEPLSPAVGAMQPTPPPVEAIPGLPARGQIFHYRDYQRGLQPGQLILGIRQDGTPKLGTWQDLKVLLILGSSASGKTTTMVEKCLCAAESGGLLVVCDPHAAKPDSLTRRITPLQGALLPGTSFAVEHDAILHNARLVREELERRRRGGSMQVPLFLVLEELNRLMRDKEIAHALQEILQCIGQEGRGFNVFAIVAAQQITGLAEIRKSILSVICHKVGESEARRCIPARFAKYSNELGVGQTFVMDADGITEPLQQVLVIRADCQAAQARLVAAQQHASAPVVLPAHRPRATRFLPTPIVARSAPHPAPSVARPLTLPARPTTVPAASTLPRASKRVSLEPLASPAPLTLPPPPTQITAPFSVICAQEGMTPDQWMERMLVAEVASTPGETSMHRAATEVLAAVVLTPPVPLPPPVSSPPPESVPQKLEALARLRATKHSS